MLQLENRSPFPAALYTLTEPSGFDSVYTVIKGTFVLSKLPAPADEQLPVVLIDEFHGDAGESSISVPSEISLDKPGTDVLLIGNAYAPRGRPTTQVDVTLAVGPVRKTVRVFGDREWQHAGVGYKPSAVAPFDSMPLTWERAYGGVDRSGAELRAESRNPVGAGFRASENGEQLESLRLPNLEDPGEPITSWKQRPSPACFAPVAPHWEPRRSYAGTYDETWQRNRAPFLPEDFDPRFFQLAPPGLVATPHLEGGESLEFGGAHPAGTLRSALPAARPAVTFQVDGQVQERPPRLDTVIIEPDADRLVMIWRSSFTRTDKRSVVNAVEVELREGS
jgi:hypothetical protein